MTLSRKEAARHLLKLHKAEASYAGYIELLHPGFTLTPFQRLLVTALDLLEKDELRADFLDVHLRGKTPDLNARTINNLMVNMPPRHGKSSYITVDFPSYYMGRNPCRYTMSCSYNSELATGFGRQVRENAANPVTAQVFPAFGMSKTSRAADAWHTTLGGAYYGVGIGGTTTGRPANLLIIDDPIKSREEAESATMRRKVWDFYTGSLSNRRQPDVQGSPPKTIVVLTRWHVDDLAGKIMETEEWKNGEWLHINFRAIEEREVIVERTSRRALPEDHPDYLDAKTFRTTSPSKRYIEKKAIRDVPLWPERFPLAFLYAQRKLNPRDFESLYQQNPYIEGGNILKSEYWRYYDQPLDHYLSIIMAADTAFKKNSQNDYSVLAIGGLTPHGDIHLLDLFRGRWDFPELKHKITTLYATWRSRGMRAVHIEDAASGQSLIQELRKNSGVAIVPKKVERDKVARVSSITDIIEAGRVWLPATAPWLDEFISECLAFPASTHDDQVDAFYILVDALSRIHMSPADFDIPINLRGSLRRTGTSALDDLMAPDREPDRDISWTKDKADSPFGGSLNHSFGLNSKSWKGWGG
ncbi:hypothetical protein GCM10023116_48050 [Kistimonas scapharcae]|uniref:Terminase large subunit gp17-like C-terminal domain-containing protein n=1 Tax=Kistimonas scapharcae TaxID=1036133 RepID=A0ABP8VAV1_9GAMM